MHRFASFAVICLFVPLAAGQGFGLDDSGFGGIPGLDEPSPASQAMEVRAVASLQQALPGQEFTVALEVVVAEGWAWYSPHPGEAALPAEILVDPETLRAGPTLWPQDQEYQTEGLDFTNRAYKGRTVVYVPVRIPADAEAGSKISMTFHVEKQVCRAGACVNLEGDNAISASTAVTVGPSTPNEAWNDVDDGLETAVKADQLSSGPESGNGAQLDFGQAVVVGQTEQGGTLWFLFLAVLAGLSFNIMPCVLPIVPMRIYSIVEMAKEKRRRMVTLGLSFALGIVLFFAAIAFVNIGVTLVRGQAYSWSEMWQYRSVRLGMIFVLVALAASMFGLFTFQVPRKINQIEASGALQKRSGHLASVGMGLMMAILSTPCTGPVLAMVMAWAQIQPLWIATLVFLLLGLGMALPHALLVAFPGLIRKMPKPGVWMEWFKQSMGFVLLLVVAWLLDTITPGGSAVAWTVAFGVVLCFGLWMWGQWVKYSDPTKKKVIVRAVAVLLVVAAGIWMLQPDKLAIPAPAGQAIVADPPADSDGRQERPAGGHAQPLSSDPMQQIQSAWSSGQPVVVKFTASWCLECKVVQTRIYDSPEVQQRFATTNALVLRADVTDKGSPGSNFMSKAFPGKAPPLTAVFVPGDDRPRLLTGLFSKQELFDLLPAVENLRTSLSD
ncbi:MAG: protein-disulfide reductase DsbD family protein [Phycisphaerae bacterium]